MFYLNEKNRFCFGTLKKFIVLFVQRLLIKNSCFLIYGEHIQTVRSSTLIKLFSKGKYRPNLNFIDNERHLAGISKVSQKENEYEMKMWLVSLQKQDPICIGSEIHQGCDDWNRGIGEEAPNHDHDDEVVHPQKQHQVETVDSDDGEEEEEDDDSTPSRTPSVPVVPVVAAVTAAAATVEAPKKKIVKKVGA